MKTFTHTGDRRTPWWPAALLSLSLGACGGGGNDASSTAIDQSTTPGSATGAATAGATAREAEDSAAALPQPTDPTLGVDTADETAVSTVIVGDQRFTTDIESDLPAVSPAAARPAAASDDDQRTVVEELSIDSEKEITPAAGTSLTPYFNLNGRDVQAVLDISDETAVGHDTELTITPYPRHFESLATEGFHAELHSDHRIHLAWTEDPQARGYNVYRDSQYHTTVFANHYIDADTVDKSYYYEIHSFDHQDRFSVIATGLTVVVRDTGRKDPSSGRSKTGFLDDYSLVFADEFDGPTLDRTKWNTRFLWGPDLVINHEDQYYVDAPTQPDIDVDPFIFDGDTMTIRATPTPEPLLNEANGQPYLSGIITSYDAFKFTYGYAETRARLPYGRGLWPAFWLLNAYYVDAKPEIDIMEFIGHDRDAVYHTYHYFDHAGHLRSTHSQPTTGIDFTNGFHTYGVRWEPGLLVFYVNGIERHRISDPNVSSQQMYVIANLALGGWWAGSPDDSTAFPADFSLDYIRVYQKIGNHSYTPQFDDAGGNIPYNDSHHRSLPNRRPGREQWPDSYSDGL